MILQIFSCSFEKRHLHRYGARVPTKNGIICRGPGGTSQSENALGPAGGPSVIFTRIPCIHRPDKFLLLTIFARDITSLIMKNKQHFANVI